MEVLQTYILETWLEQVATFGGSLIILAISFLCSMAARELMKRTKNNDIAWAQNCIVIATNTATRMVQQTYVDALKEENGYLTEVEASEARKRVADTVVEIVPLKAVRILESKKMNLGRLIEAIIESNIKAMKRREL